MKKNTELEVRRALAKELGLLPKHITLYESSGDIESFRKDQNSMVEISQETFSFSASTSKHIDLGFCAKVQCARIPGSTKHYAVLYIERNEIFDNQLRREEV